MTAMADEHPRGILLYNTHCVFMSPVSLILVIFFPRSQDKSRETLFFFFHPNKSPHTEVNNINTYVSGVSAGALLKLIFQNVFSALPPATGEPSHPQLPNSQYAPCGMTLRQGSWHWMLSAGSTSSQVTGKCSFHSFQKLLQSSISPSMAATSFLPLLALMISDCLITGSCCLKGLTLLPEAKMTC